MSLARFHNVSKWFDQQCVLRDIDFRLRADDRIGLIGKNGTGKTTVLRLTLGQEEPTAGTVDTNDGLRIGYFSQFSELQGDLCVTDILESCFRWVHDMEAELDDLDEAIATGDTARRSHALNRQAELLDQMEERGGWTYQNRIATALTKLGFDDTLRARPVAQLSGGWRNRASLAKILLEEPDVLLLDEPTNFLDVDGTLWLEQWIAQHPGALMVVSHDRHFLDSVVSRIIEIENRHFQAYDGGFSEYVRQKQFRFKTLRNQFVHEEELLIFESEAIRDRRESIRNPGRYLRRKLADVKKRVEPRPVDRVITRLYEKLKVGNVLCRIQELSMGFADECLFEDVSFDICRGDRIVVVGPNGCGKSTLIRCVVGQEEVLGGRVKWLGNTTYSVFNDVLDALDPNDTVTHAVNVVPLAYYAQRKVVNQFLSLFQFSDMDLQKRIGTLSGGQKARVALAQCLLSGATVILLDEPTNHLDVTSTQVMERALMNFPGAVVVVSHDRFFIDKVATQLQVFSGNAVVTPFAGNWSMWQASRS